MQTTTLSFIEEFDQLIIEAEKLCERRNPEALFFIEKAEQSLSAKPDSREQSLLSYIRAFYDCFVSNNYDAAIDRLTTTLSCMGEELYNSLGHKLLMTLGNAQQMKGDLFSAQESYLKGLKVLGIKQNLTAPEKLFFAAFYYNLSILLSTSELKIESEDYLEEAIEIYTELDKKFKLSQCFVAYAQMLERKTEYPKAIQYLKRALALGKEIEDPYIIALAKANLGVLSIKTNEHKNALSYLKTALEYYVQNAMTYETGMVKFELGKALIHVGNFEEGIASITEAEKLMMELDNKKELSDIYRTKSKALTANGNHEEANIYLEKYIESVRFFFDNEKTNALTRAKKEFESEMKEKQARFLKEKNREIQEYAYKLEVSNNELKQFASVASHDLKEPLRMISSYMFLLKKSLDGKATESQTEFFDFAIDGARRMEQMIHDLLRLAKVDANPRIEKVKLPNVIEEIKLNLRNLIDESNAEIQTDHLPVLMADRAQMVQLFQNLIANGINYNNSKAPLIKISCNETQEDIEIKVADNGVGIPEYFKEAAFQIFKSMPNQTDTKGTGIGLSICKKIVEKMGGKIRIDDNKAGSGTVFIITLSKSLMQVPL